jgi:hypothetical protein
LVRRAVSADLNADQSPGAVKSGTADSSRGVYDLSVITIEDRRQIGTLIRDGWINVDQNTDRKCYPETKRPHLSPHYSRGLKALCILEKFVIKSNRKKVNKVSKCPVHPGSFARRAWWRRIAKPAAFGRVASLIPQLVGTAPLATITVPKH